jgi:hypothetical protein
MPTIKNIPGPYRFFFYSFDCNEPEHIHVQRERMGRTPDVVEFAVSPHSLDPIRAARLIQRGRAGGTACPTCEALAIARNGSAHFPRHAEIAGRHQEF